MPIEGGVVLRGRGRLKNALDRLFSEYHRREFVHPDPLEFLYAYSRTHDREIAALVASSLAYGRVRQILKSVGSVLEVLGPSPRSFLLRADRRTLLRSFKGFTHRFTKGRELADLLWRARAIIQRHGSLGKFFARSFPPESETVLPALSAFAAELTGGRPSSLIPDPERGSACKRLHLFLRWLVRSDAVDPGGWTAVPPRALIVPLDTHMYRIGKELGFTRRASADLRAALEITAAFRALSPEDPVKYDFALTRLGIRSDTDMERFFLEAGAGGRAGASRSRRPR